MKSCFFVLRCKGKAISLSMQYPKVIKMKRVNVTVP